MPLALGMISAHSSISVDPTRAWFMGGSGDRKAGGKLKGPGGGA